MQKKFRAQLENIGPSGAWMHAAMHLIVGGIVLALMWWLLGCLIMFVTKKPVSPSNHRSTTAIA